MKRYHVWFRPSKANQAMGRARVVGTAEDYDDAVFIASSWYRVAKDGDMVEIVQSGGNPVWGPYVKGGEYKP